MVAADRKKERDAKKSDIMKSPASIGFPSPAEKYLAILVANLFYWIFFLAFRVLSMDQVFGNLFSEFIFSYNS